MRLAMEPRNCHIGVTGQETVLAMVTSPAMVTVTGEGAIMLLTGATSLARRLVTWPGCHLAHIATAGHVARRALTLTSDTM